MEDEVKEIYEGECIMEGAKFLLIIYESGKLKLTWYYHDRVEERVNPKFEECGKGLRLVFGTEKYYSSIPFKTYHEGTLDKRWTKIK